MKKISIIIDNKIPYIAGVFEPFADVRYLAPDAIDRNAVKDADALIVRTRTSCNEALLAGSNVKFIATATIGYDHIDTSYCNDKNIRWTNAPGCNASSVGGYIVSSLLLLSLKSGESLQGKCIGIVGVGNVGRIVASYCETLGMRVLLNDPPREDSEGSTGFSGLDSLSENCDFITFHTPLNRTGKYKTFHLGDDSFFRNLKRQPVILNAARGEIIDNARLLEAYHNGYISDMVIDCWEGEPFLNKALLEKAFIATPHIAGYSADGKSNASRMAATAVASFFDLPVNLASVVAPSPPNNLIYLMSDRPLDEAVFRTYNPLDDTRNLKQQPEKFEWLRGNYPLRREFRAYRIEGACKTDTPILKGLGFQVSE